MTETQTAPAPPGLNGHQNGYSNGYSNGTGVFIEPPAPQQHQLFDHAICMVVEISKLGNSKKIRAGQLDIKADPKRIKAQKTLLESAEMDAIRRFFTEVKSYVYAKSLPSMFKGGIYLLPIASIEEVDYQMQQFAQRLAPLVDALCAVYPQCVEKSRTDLKEFFSINDYPDVVMDADQTIRLVTGAPTLHRAFSLNWRYVTVGVPGKLANISKDVFERESAKAEAQWTEALDNAKAVLREGMAELVGHMLERLQPGPDGKKKVFRQSTVSNMMEFLNEFQAKNLANDEELQGIVTRAKNLLGGVDASVLRRFGDIKETVATGFSEIKDELDKLVVNQPTRFISFEDE